MISFFIITISKYIIAKTAKKVGNAINRNKIRRRIKESYRLNIDANVKYGYDIVFIARVAIKEADYKDIEKSMNHLIRKAGLI